MYFFFVATLLLRRFLFHCSAVRFVIFVRCDKGPFEAPFSVEANAYLSEKNKTLHSFLLHRTEHVRWSMIIQYIGYGGRMRLL